MSSHGTGNGTGFSFYGFLDSVIARHILSERPVEL
jgi:hypothetical protein